MTQAACQLSDLPSSMAVKIEVTPEAGCWLWTSNGNGEGRRGYGQRLPSCEGRQSLPGVWRSGGSSVNPGRLSDARHADPWGRHYTLCCKPDRLEAVPRVGSCAAQGLGGCASREDALSPLSGVHIEAPVRGPMRVSAVPGVPRREGHEPPGSPGRVRFRET